MKDAVRRNLFVDQARSCARATVSPSVVVVKSRSKLVVIKYCKSRTALKRLRVDVFGVVKRNIRI
jgi:hypothetical protein